MLPPTKESLKLGLLVLPLPLTRMGGALWGSCCEGRSLYESAVVGLEEDAGTPKEEEAPLRSSLSVGVPVAVPGLPGS